MGDKIKLLIVDDSPDDRETYERFIRQEMPLSGHLAEASTAQEALNAMATGSFDCILLDYHLPDDLGLNLFEEISRLQPSAAVIMLTGQGNEDIAVDAMKAGANDYLRKGELSPTALARSITNAVMQQRLAEQLRSKRKSIEIFTRAMAHDLKEPLRTIRSFTQIVSDALDPASEHHVFLNFVLRSADNMDNLINSISRYTNLDIIQEIALSPVSPHDIAVAVTTNLNALIESSHATVTVEDGSAVQGDTSLVIQLVQNLVSNAIHHCTDHEPEILIRTEDHLQSVQLFVHDNGPGIAEEHHELIFQPFERLAGGERDGTGLGLAICQKIMDLHGGTIRCISGIAGGATFVAAFPKHIASDVTLH